MHVALLNIPSVFVARIACSIAMQYHACILIWDIHTCIGHNIVTYMYGPIYAYGAEQNQLKILCCIIIIINFILTKGTQKV